MASSASANVVVSCLRRGFILATVIAFLSLNLPTSTSALPLTDVVSQAMLAAKTPRQERHKRDVTKTECTVPSNAQLQDMLTAINSDMDRSTFLQRTWNGKAISVPSSTSNGEAVEFAEIVVDENESRTCPSTITRIDAAPLNHRSLCPFYTEIRKLPEGYYPPTLQWAKCKCQRCVENRGFACEAVKTRMAVLKPAGCYQGMQKYEEQIIRVNTACACAFKASIAEPVPVSSGGWVS